jgi:chromosomal replication initiation ATPase DnaA
VYAGFLLGSVGFIKDKLQDLEIQITSDDVTHKKVLRDDAQVAEDIIAAVTKYYKTTMNEISRSTDRPMREKHVLVYLLRTYTGLSNREIGAHVAMRHSAVSKAGMAIERLLETDRKMKSAISSIVSKFEG